MLAYSCTVSHASHLVILEKTHQWLFSAPVESIFSCISTNKMHWFSLYLPFVEAFSYKLSMKIQSWPSMLACWALNSDWRLKFVQCALDMHLIYLDAELKDARVLWVCNNDTQHCDKNIHIGYPVPTVKGNLKRINIWVFLVRWTQLTSIYIFSMLFNLKNLNIKLFLEK